MSLRFAGIAGLVALALAGMPAQAQKSADTLRLAITDMFPFVHPYMFPQPEQWSFTLGVYQGLLGYDERNRKYVGILASDWRRIDTTTLEFDLRPNIRFHNGAPLTPEDFKATYEWAADPKSPVPTPGSYNWVDNVEIMGPHKIRIHTKQPDQSDMLRFAYNMKVMNKKALESHENAGDYGRLTPYGTGPYKVVSFDRNEGVLVERNEDYHHDPAGYFRAPVKRLKGIPIRDIQAQQAQLMTGGIDLMREVPVDMAKGLANVPNLAVTASTSKIILFVHFDAAGRSENKAMTDVRVRKAFIMAVDREPFVKNIIAGGEIAEIPAGLCFKSNIACEVENKPYDYNPAEAKRLLAEAGYPNGLDLTLQVLAPYANIATAIAGEVRKVGIRATVDPLPQSLYLQKRGEGSLTAYMGTYPTGVGPDVGNTLKLFFNGTRDYWRDPVINNAWQTGETEFDLAKRTKLYVPALNAINEKAYFLPISELPVLWAHSKDVKVLSNPLSTADPKLGDYAWSDFVPKEYR
jgi:peptide/nickel transport system substrate-binding protein